MLPHAPTQRWATRLTTRHNQHRNVASNYSLHQVFHLPGAGAPQRLRALGQQTRTWRDCRPVASTKVFAGQIIVKRRAAQTVASSVHLSLSLRHPSDTHDTTNGTALSPRTHTPVVEGAARSQHVCSSRPAWSPRSKIFTDTRLTPQRRGTASFHGR